MHGKIINQRFYKSKYNIKLTLTNNVEKGANYANRNTLECKFELWNAKLTLP